MKTPSKINNVEDIEFLHAIEANGDVVIDFGPVEFIRPVGIVALLATLDRLMTQQGGRKVTFRLPESQDVREYLLLSEAFEAMRRLIRFDGIQPEDVISESEPERPMVPCRYFETESEIEQIANQMEEDFESVLPGRGSILGTCHTAFSELATNVIYHAESKGGYVLAQKYEFASGSRVEIAVADCGIGIRASLQKNQKYTHIASDTDAIELAIGEGVSSLEDRYRGYGLYHVTDDVRMSSNRRLTIRSGSGTIVLYSNGNVEKRESSPSYSGTILNVSIPC